MVQCPICGEEFDSEKGMKIHKSQKHSQEKNSEKQKETKEKDWLWKRDPQVALVTTVAILAMLLLTTVFVLSVQNLDLQTTKLEKNQTEIKKVYKPPDIDKALCGKKGVDKMIYCSNSTACAPQEDKEVKIIAIHAPGKEPSTQQRQILKNLSQNNPELETQYICRSTTENSETCENQTWGTPYKEWEQGEHYTVPGLPTLIINCEYRRSGTYASTKPEKEKTQLQEIIDAF